MILQIGLKSNLQLPSSTDTIFYIFIHTDGPWKSIFISFRYEICFIIFFARRNKNIQYRRMGGCGSRKELNGKKFNNNVSDIWKIHTGVGERTWRAEKKRKRKLWWWYPERISNKTTYTMSPHLHTGMNIHGDGKVEELSRREVRPW